jgi:glycine cleavage system H protein
MEFPDNLFYTKDHEWVRVEGNMVTVGITDYAQEQLGDIVFVDLPSKGQDISKDDTFGVVESVKSVSDCFSPITGKVVDINEDLAENPAMINEDCYGDGWMVRIEVKNSAEIKGLMKATEYESFVKEEAA